MGKINIRLLLAPFALALMGLPAHADIMYVLDNNGSGCCSGPYATITLTAVDADTVKVTEHLLNGDVWALSSGVSLAFNVDESFSFVKNSFSNGFGPAKGAGPYVLNPFHPGFSSAVDCIDPTFCGSGGTSAKFTGDLVFEITNNLNGLTPSDFKDTNGEYFASDIGVPNGDRNYTTGNLATNTPGTDPPTVPEPGSIVLFGTILAGVLTGLGKGRSRSGKQLV